MPNSFNSPDLHSANWFVRGVPFVGTGYAVLVRAQEMLIERFAAWDGDGSKAHQSYRVGGPLSLPRTGWSSSHLVIDAKQGSVANAALWLAIARIARPGVSDESLCTGAPFAADDATRNILDKIEQSLADGAIHPTALEAMLFLIANDRQGVTWGEFVRKAVALPEQTPAARAALPRWLMDVVIPAPSVGASLIYPRGTEVADTTYMLLFERRYVAAEESVSYGDVVAMVNAAMARMIPADRMASIGPRVTRTLFVGTVAGVSSHVVLTAAFPVTLAKLPVDLAALDGRVKIEIVRRITPPPLPSVGGSVRSFFDEHWFLQILATIAMPAPMLVLMEPHTEWALNVKRYTPLLFGPLEWWSTPEALQTSTREQLGANAATAATRDNPYGPGQIVNAGLLPFVREAAEQTSSTAPWLIAGTLIITALIFKSEIAALIPTPKPRALPPDSR